MAVDFWEQPQALEQGQGQTPFKTRQKSAIPGISGDIFCTNTWDVLYLDDEPMPGVCDVAGVVQLKLDDKKAKGQHGSVLTISGYQPGPFEIIVKTWTPEQFEILCNKIDTVWNIPLADAASSNPKVRAAGKKAIKKAHTCSHPKLDMYKIAFCEVQGVTFPEPGPEPGTMVVRFKCKQVKAPGKALATKTPKASGPTRIPDYATKDRPANLPSEAPSTNPKNLQPGGPPAAPASGE